MNQLMGNHTNKMPLYVTENKILLKFDPVKHLESL